MFFSNALSPVLLLLFLVFNFSTLLTHYALTPIYTTFTRRFLRTYTTINLLGLYFLVNATVASSVALAVGLYVLWHPTQHALRMWFNWVSFYITTSLGIVLSTATTPFSQLLVLECASLLATAFIIALTLRTAPRVNLATLLKPLIALNFITYGLLVALLVLEVNSVAWAAGGEWNPASGIFLLYLGLKLMFTPLVLYKQPLYNTLSYSQIWLLAQITLLITVPACLGLAATFNPLSHGVVPTLVLLIAPLLKMCYTAATVRELLLYSTSVTMFLALLAVWVV